MDREENEELNKIIADQVTFLMAAAENVNVNNVHERVMVS